MQAAEEGEFVGARLDAGLRAARFASPPSADEFEADIEPKNVPSVFRGVAKEWDASSRWDPLHGGLDYLLGKVGPDEAVQAMMSNSGHVFYGDIRNHERVSIPFSTFIQSCKSYLRHVNAAPGSSIVQAILKEQGCSGETSSSSSDHTEQVYLAQVSILNTESNDRCSLEILKEDIQEPIFLRGKSFSSINFWMNRAHLRSSTHYDPHHNLLCVVAGCKKVTLWPPSASPFLYPMPVYGEASNHSSVSIEEPDYSSYTRARYMKEYSERVVLNCGDVLFIPEGWYHQVDSDDLTIAINFWWKSRIMTQMLEHMDAYYLRRILSSEDWWIRRWNGFSFHCWKPPQACTGFYNHLGQFIVQPIMNTVVQRNPFDHSEDSTGVQPMDKVLAGVKLFDLHKDSPLQALEPSTLQALYELISLVHEGVEVINQNDIAEPASQDSSPSQSNETKMIAGADDSSLLDKDPVAKIVLPVEPLELRSMLLTMVHTFPRTLEALVLNMLGPAGAEILTRKFDEMDQQTTTEEQTEFYETFYSVFEDQYAAMDKLLNGKELFSFQVFQNVLDKYLRVHVDRPS